MTVEQVDAQFKLVEQIHDLRAEIERLRDEVRRHRVRREQEKVKTIEECARKIAVLFRGNSAEPNDYNTALADAVAAIRALKDK